MEVHVPEGKLRLGVPLRGSDTQIAHGLDADLRQSRECAEKRRQDRDGGHTAQPVSSMETPPEYLKRDS